jgi:integrase/recombinase XerD
MIKTEVFELYLRQQGFSKHTRYGYHRKLEQFNQWAEENNIKPEEATLQDLYDYKRYQKERGLSENTIRHHMIAIKHFHRSLNRDDNPAMQVKYQRQQTAKPSNLLSEAELKEFYCFIKAGNIIQRRDKVMMGMVIFQGLKKEELNNLDLSHINLDETTVYIGSTRISNSRTLELHPMQMPHVLEYLYEYRPKLLQEANKKTEKLFFSMGQGLTINSALQRKLRSLKREYPLFKSIKQIKESRMTLWVKQYGIRQAQYLSGIRYASSMLRYKQEDFERLGRKLQIGHPMEGNF